MDRLRHGGVGAGGEGTLEPLALHAQREDDHLDVLVELPEALNQCDGRLRVIALVDQDDVGPRLRDTRGRGLARIHVTEKLERAVVAQARANRPYDQWVVGYD